jgi:hypothetical protein
VFSSSSHRAYCSRFRQVLLLRSLALDKAGIVKKEDNPYPGGMGNEEEATCSTRQGALSIERIATQPQFLGTGHGFSKGEYT